MSYIQLKNVSVGFGPPGNRTEVLSNVNLSVEQNEFVAVAGFSGSGKSTLMFVLAGLLKPDSGEVLINGKPAGQPGTDRGIMFQNYALLPWLSAEANIELAVRQVAPDSSAAERMSCVQKYIDLVSLTGSELKKPHQLSGGMRQRLSLARTLSMRPDILLLDEPFSALDALTRTNLQDEILKIWETDRRTVVMITNDIDEAVLMADRIIALTPGPGATLGESFSVDFSRPRDRRTLSADPKFKSLRHQLTRYMLEISRAARNPRPGNTATLPELQPRDFAI